MYFGIAIEIWVFAGLMVLAILFLMSMLARLYRKAGPHEALIVYGFRGTRVVQGHGTVIFPMVENCKDLSLRSSAPAPGPSRRPPAPASSLTGKTPTNWGPSPQPTPRPAISPRR